MCLLEGRAASPEPNSFRDLGRRLSNWNRWGSEDRIGTLNHITPERLAAAGREIRTGQLLNLGLPIGAKGIQLPGAGRNNPVHLMSMTQLDTAARPDRMICTDDYIFMPLQSVTQWDGLGHVGYDGLLYNGVPVETITTTAGSSRLSIDQTASKGIAGRGVLLDIARLHGVERLEPDARIAPDDLNAAQRRQGVEVQPGDIVLVRTGWLRHFTVDGDVKAYWNGSPGLALECAQWLFDREVAAVASDNWAVEFVPAVPLTEISIPFHCVAIRDMGLTLGEIFVLDELGDLCERTGRWSFFLGAPPLLVVGGVGSPITPMAIF